MTIEQLTEQLARQADCTCRANNLGPQEAISALMAAGIASAFTYMAEGADMFEVSSDLVGFVNATCARIIEGLKNAEEAASNG